MKEVYTSANNYDAIINKLWGFFDKLRGHSKLPISECFVPLLGLVLLRYFDSKFLLTQEKLVDIGKIEKEGTDNKDLYKAKGAIYVPLEARFSTFLNLSENIGLEINNAIEAIENENQELVGIFPKVYDRFEQDVIMDFLSLLGEISSDANSKIFGDIFDYFIIKMAKYEGKSGSDYYTPNTISQLLVNILKPKYGSLSDPACGSGNILLQAVNFAQKFDKNAQNNLKIYGNEINPNILSLCKMNLLIHGQYGDIRNINSHEETSNTNKFDYILSNPPFNARNNSTNDIENDPRYPFGIPLKSNANYLWIQEFYSSLNNNGRAGFVMPNSASDSKGADLEIRKKLIQAQIVDVMISAGPNFFQNTAIACSLWFLDKGKRNTERKGKVLFIDAKKLYKKASNGHNEFSLEHIEQLSNIVRLYREENENETYISKRYSDDKYVDIPGLCKAVTIEEIETQGWSLNPEKYICEKNDFDEKRTIDSVATEFKRLGYEVLNGHKEDFGAKSIFGRVNSSEVILRSYLYDSTKRLNPAEDEDIIEQTINNIMVCSNDNRLVFKNLVLYNYIKNGVIVKIKKQGKEINKLVKVIDWEYAENNRFTIITNFHLTNRQYDRYIDILGFVNGIPLMFFETKNYIGRPIDDDQKIIDNFIGELPKLFWYNAFIVFYNGIQSFIGCVSDTSSNLFEWNKTKNNDNNSLTSLLALVQKICVKDKLLDRVENFTTFTEVNNLYKKQIAMDHQIQAVNNAYKAVNEIEKNKGRLGIVQQAQGSGRTQTILYFVQKILRKMPGKWSFVIITDRIEHDESIFQMFEMAGIVADKNVKAQNCEHLRQLLNENNDVIFTTIQKFNTGDDVLLELSERRNIIVLVYEVNTSQYGAYAMNMRNAIPNAAFIGFTSTLLNKRKVNEVFGDYLSTYNYNQSVEDGMAVSVLYESRLTEAHIKDEYFHMFQDDSYNHVELDEEKNIRLMLGSDYRQDKIAEDIVHHFINREYMGKAMVVTQDRISAARMYEKVKKHWAKYIDKLYEDITLYQASQVKGIEEKIEYMKNTDMAVVISKNKDDDYMISGEEVDFQPYLSRIHNENLEMRFKDPNDMLRLVFVCSMWINGIDVPNLDTIYLDKAVNNNTLMQIISRTTRIHEGKKHGLIVDYIGVYEKMREVASEFLLYENSSGQEQILYSNTEESVLSFEQDTINKLEDELTKLGTYIGKGYYAEGRDCLLRIVNIDSMKGRQLAEELMFLYNLEGSLAQDEESWNKYKTQIDWKCRIWRILSENSTSVLGNMNENDDENKEQKENVYKEFEQVEEEIKTNHELKPVEKGALLENSVLELLEKFFDICEESRKEIIEKIKLRRQKSGTQFGFDIDFAYRNKANETVECVIECKNYEREVKLDDILPKLEQLRVVTRRKIEHWILISPYRNIDNYLNNILPIWEEEGRWDTIKNVQVWTPDNNVYEFFGIVPEVYDVFYPINYAQHPQDWSEEKKQRIISKWEKMLQPSITLPKEWKEYLRNPNKILLMNESDPGTSRDYSLLYENYVEMKCQDESGSIIEGTLEEYLRKWLDNKNSFTKILLGDFGDGKTFFTYTFSRNLIKEYIEAPEIGWIPVRLALQDLEEKGTSQDFIERRLKNFGVSLDSWNKIKMNYRVLVILDGFDEMSLSINNTSVQENIKRLADCYKAFKGMKVLITSRKMFFNNKVKRDLLLQRIGEPEIIQIAPINKYDEISHLNNCAKTIEEKQKLRILKETNDIIGLASKPLFLNMVKTTLHSDKIVALDNVSIYEEYIANSFERKFFEQLECNETIVSKEIILKNLRDILECLALTLQELGRDSISINEFKEFSGKEDMAKYLWDISNTMKHVEEDASERISLRSLLKCISINENEIQSVAFCHRSMREYFVARGICRLLHDDINKAESILKKCDISYEIVIFTSQYIKKYCKKEQMDLHIQNLKRLIQKTKGKHEDIQRNEYARLGCNCANILYQMIMELPGDDWSGLLMDNANLSDASFSGKDFSYTSLKYANLDNADFSNADFRFCDLTGVRIEETHPIKSLTVPEEADRILAAYSDGVVREWRFNRPNVITIAENFSKSDIKLFALPQNSCSILQDNEMLFHKKQEDKFGVQARFKLKQDLRLLKAGKDSILILINNENTQENKLQLINLELQKIMIYTSVSSYAVCEHLGFEAFVIYDVLSGLRLISYTRKLQNIVHFPEVNNVTCMSTFCVHDKSYIIAVGQKDGIIQLWEACCKHERWCVKLLGKNNFSNSFIREIKFINHDMIAISGLDGVIYVAEIHEYLQLKVKYELKLKISCKNMEIDGLLQEREYRILEGLIKNQI